MRFSLRIFFPRFSPLRHSLPATPFLSASQESSKKKKPRFWPSLPRISPLLAPCPSLAPHKASSRNRPPLNSMVASAFQRALAPLQTPFILPATSSSATASSSSSPCIFVVSQPRRFAPRRRSVSALAARASASPPPSSAGESGGVLGGGGRRPAPARAVAEAPPRPLAAVSANERPPSLSAASEPPEDPPTYVDDAGRRIVASECILIGKSRAHAA